MVMEDLVTYIIVGGVGALLAWVLFFFIYLSGRPKEKTIVIVVTKRTADYHACIEGKPGIWAAGKVPYKAVGDLIMHHSEKFGVAVRIDSN